MGAAPPPPARRGTAPLSRRGANPELRRAHGLRDGLRVRAGERLRREPPESLPRRHRPQPAVLLPQRREGGQGEAGGGPRGNPAGGDPIHHFPQGRHGSGGELACLPVGAPAPGGAGPAAPRRLPELRCPVPGRHLLVGGRVGGEESALLGQRHQEPLEFRPHLRGRRRHLGLPQELCRSAEPPEAHAADHLPRESRVGKAFRRRRRGAAGCALRRLVPGLLQQGGPLSLPGAGDAVEDKLLLRSAARAPPRL